MQSPDIEGKTVLVTGAGRRLGAAIATGLHAAGMNVAIHYQHSESQARALAEKLEADRAGSASLHALDLHRTSSLPGLIAEVVDTHGELHALVNNASSFYPTPLETSGESDWDDVVGTNLKAPYFLSQAAAPALRESGGCIVNLADIYGLRPLPQHTIYNATKAGLIMLTQSLALELAPDVRINAIAPGPILWPETEVEPAAKDAILANTPLARCGEPDEIVAAMVFLLRDARFSTGVVLPVDGGRRLAGY